MFCQAKAQPHYNGSIRRYHPLRPVFLSLRRRQLLCFFVGYQPECDHVWERTVEQCSSHWCPGWRHRQWRVGGTQSTRRLPTGKCVASPRRMSRRRHSVAPEQPSSCWIRDAKPAFRAQIWAQPPMQSRNDLRAWTLWKRSYRCDNPSLWAASMALKRWVSNSISLINLLW